MPYSLRHHSRARRRASSLQRLELLAGEAVVAGGLHGPLDTALVLRGSDPGGVDEEAPVLRILLEGDVDHRVERVGDVHDRLGVVGDDDPEDSGKVCPGDLARLDGVGGLLREDRVYEAVPRENRGEDERFEVATLTVFAGLQQSHPAGIELELLAGPTVSDRDGEPAFAEPKFRDGEAVQGRVTDIDPLPQKKFARLGQPDAILDEAGDLLPVLLADRPSFPVGAPRTCSEGGENVRELLVGQGVDAVCSVKSALLCDLEVATDRVPIEPDPSHHRLSRQAGQPLPQDFLHFDHRDLAVCHVPSGPCPKKGRRKEGHTIRSRRGG